MTLRDLETPRDAPGGWPSLRGIALEICEGERIAITGPAGAGKTALFRVLALRETRWSGEFVILGRSLRTLRWSDQRRLVPRWIGAMPEDFPLIDELSVGENLEIPLVARMMDDRSRRKGVIRRVLRRIGLQRIAGETPSAMSNGDRQLVALAKAVIAEPPLLVLDDPFRAMSRAQMVPGLELIRDVAAGGSTIVLFGRAVPAGFPASRYLRMNGGHLRGIPLAPLC